MVHNRRKKVSRQRGKRWHGWGRGAAHHKGAGNRGGRGRAGSGKRADQKKPSYQKEGKGYLGKHGFTSILRKEIKAINIDDLQERMEAYVSLGLATKKGDQYIVDISELGYNKLLGTGKVKLKLEVKAEFASAGAAEKIKAAGGKLEVLTQAATEEAKEE